MNDWLFKFVAVSSIAEDVLTFSGLIVGLNQTSCDILCPRKNKFVVLRFKNAYIKDRIDSGYYKVKEDVEVIKQAVKYIFSGEI